MARLLHLASAALIAGCVLGAPAGPGTAVKAVRHWQVGNVSRVVIEVSGEFEYSFDRVPNPDRLFFDILDSRIAIPRAGRTVAIGNDLLKQIRMAETQPGVTRVVFDLGANVEYTASRLSNPARLIVELRTGIPAAPPPMTPPPAEPKPEPVLTPPEAAPVKTTPGPQAELKIPARSLPPPPAPAKPVKQASTMPAPPSATAAKLPRGSESMTRVLGLKIGKIVIDPGHGGHDTGTMGRGGLLEKDLVLDVSKRLAVLVQTRLGAEVVLTRSDDTFIPLERRTEMANEHKADLFLSVHANSSPERTSSGVETFYLNFTSDKAALEVATRENASSQKTVFELRDLVQKIALQEKIEESRQFAEHVQKAVYSTSARANSRAKNRGVKKAPFVVLIGASMPSVLAEIGFVSNPRDESLFKRPDHRQKLAEGLYKGLSKYAETLSHFQVAQK
jgi:N-acetylmuramoyl-L-alanine amidase